MEPKKKILIVEDDTFTRDVYVEALSDAGFEVTQAADGQIGLDMAKQGGFDLILLDMMLPKIDGLGILRGLKNEVPQKPNGPIILLTNLSHDPILKLAGDLGVTEHIIKSDIDPGQLIEKVKGNLEAKKAKHQDL